MWPPVDVRFGSDLQMQRGPIRRPFRLWRGWRSWRRWRFTTLARTVLFSLGLLGCGIAMAAAGARSDQPPESGDPLQGLLSLLTIILILISPMLAWALSSRLLRPLLLQPSGLSTTPQLDDEHLAYLSAGPTRVIELGLASLVLRGVLRPNPSTRTLLLMGRIDEASPGIAQQVLTVYRHLALHGSSSSTAVAYTDIATLSRYEFNSLREFLQSQELLLKGLAKLIIQWGGNPFAMIMMSSLFTGLFMPNDVRPFLYLLLPPLWLGFGRGIKHPSGRTIWGDSVLQRYQTASTHADPLQRIALLGPAAMSGGRLDDLRRLIENVEADSAADSATACGC
jgi:uncharacterized protein (TIGR04222 family)